MASLRAAVARAELVTSALKDSGSAAPAGAPKLTAVLQSLPIVSVAVVAVLPADDATDGRPTAGASMALALGRAYEVSCMVSVEGGSAGGVVYAPRSHKKKTGTWWVVLCLQDGASGGLVALALRKLAALKGRSTLCKVPFSIPADHFTSGGRLVVHVMCDSILGLDTSCSVDVCIG